MKKQILKVCPVQEFGFGDYNYFVETPEGEFFYFNLKSQANNFIEFYHEYQNKRNLSKSINVGLCNYTIHH